MTTTGYLVWLIFMAIATITILTVGTLGAADLLPRRRPRPTQDVVRARPGKAQRDDVVFGRDPEPLDALAPLGSSLLAGTHLAPAPTKEARGLPEEVAS